MAGKLTESQREWLQWVSDAGGATDITDKRIALPMLRRGLVSYDTFQDTWRITPSGRAALEDKHG